MVSGVFIGWPELSSPPDLHYEFTGERIPASWTEFRNELSDISMSKPARQFGMPPNKDEGGAGVTLDPSPALVL